MNLSTYLQMPPAPTPAQGTSNPAAQGAAALAGQAVGASLGFDFAQVMAKQMVRFNPQQRQEFAASPAASPAHDARLNDREPVDTRSDRSDTRSHTAEDARQADVRDSDTRNDDANADHAQHPRRSSKLTQAKADTSQPDPLAAVMTQLAAVATPVQTNSTATEAAATGTSATDATTSAMAGVTTPPETSASPSTDPLSQMASHLRTIELSPRVRIITDPKQAPNPESLAEFAKSMGLDDNAIQSLMGQAAPTSTPTPTGVPASNGLPNAAALATQANAAVSAQDSVTPDGLQALTSTTLQNAQISVTPNTTAPVAVPTPTTGEFAHGSLLPAMSQADMASIQQLQVTVLPAAAALPIAAQAGSKAATATGLTTEPLSLLGGSLLEHDIAELASSFADSGTDMGADSQSGDSANSGFGFGQAMASAIPADKTGSSKTANTQASQSMTEVYDQLSDKLSTEMAARIHKQLSDGQWKMKFGLRPENLGGVEIQLEMKDGKLDAVFRADNPLARDLLQNSSQRLRDALENFGIQAGLVHVGQDGGNAQHRQSGHSTNQPQVGHNSPTQRGQGEDVATTTDTTVRNKANASLLDLYA